MRLSRDLANRIRHVMDEWLPPILRDARWFMYPLFLAFYGRQAKLFMDFKENALQMNETAFQKFYADTVNAPPHGSRETDLNQKSIELILQNLLGTSVLEVGPGKGFLAKKMSTTHQVTVADIHLDRNQFTNTNIVLTEAPIERLPFEAGAFETVVCAHTLEHVLDLDRALAELRRVARKRLIIVVPCQRPYRFTFDPHLQFFPYRHSLLIAFKAPMERARCESVDGDWFYVENLA